MEQPDEQGCSGCVRCFLLLLRLYTSGLRRLRLWSRCTLCSTPGSGSPSCPHYRCVVCTCATVHRQLNTFFDEEPGWNKGAGPRESIGCPPLLGLDARLAPWLLV